MSSEVLFAIGAWLLNGGDFMLTMEAEMVVAGQRYSKRYWLL